ncbi:hypothetical protein [Caballeronia sp. LZ001]|uniref:hypothetical protein n=1 Tax=Caballeronia sp. LZ001 TaxID=3038553 RepID=UPI0028636E79|nr:hypothetical protein [Caballeronia sp. LZ001]MDR5802130.1 hypothetical protein [Caballeronia sp. LZ001]
MGFLLRNTRGGGVAKRLLNARDRRASAVLSKRRHQTRAVDRAVCPEVVGIRLIQSRVLRNLTLLILNRKIVKLVALLRISKRSDLRKLCERIELRRLNAKSDRRIDGHYFFAPIVLMP